MLITRLNIREIFKGISFADISVVEGIFANCAEFPAFVRIGVIKGGLIGSVRVMKQTKMGMCGI